MHDNHKNIRSYLFFIFLCSALTLFIGGCAHKNNDGFIPREGNYIKSSSLLDDTAKLQNNPYSDLSVPTYVTYIDGIYFIVDCYHNEVIYSDDIEKPLNEWYVMTDDMIMGHTVASDGSVYLIDDTENNRVLVMEKSLSEDDKPLFVRTQEFSDIGVRPHYIIYREKDRTFYVWSSLSGQMYLFKRDSASNDVYLTDVKSIPELYGFYVRSFTIEGDDIYFVSGNSSIIKADIDTFEIKERYPVPDEIAGMVQLTVKDGRYFITVSTDAKGDQDYATMIVCDDLKDLAEGDYEDIYHFFVGGGTPYYISFINGRYYLTEHRIPGHSVWSFDINDGNIVDVKEVF